jgi:hypothetical protein
MELEFLEHMKKTDVYCQIVEPTISEKTLQYESFYVWDPSFLNFPELKSKILNIKCPECANKMTYDGYSPSGYRVVFDVGRRIILLGKMLECTNRSCKKKVVNYDRAIMKQYPAFVQEMFPFHLAKKTAITNAVINLIRTSVMNGISFNKIVSNINESIKIEDTRKEKRYYSYHSTMEKTKKSRMDYYLKSNAASAINPFKLLDSSVLPKTSAILFYLQDYVLKEEFVKKMLKEAVKGSVLKADFTFKITKFVRVENGRPYQALLSIMNEFKQIVYQKLCISGENSADLEEALKEIADLYPELIYSDTCCAEESLYRKYFPTAKVKLDLFHFLQRFTRRCYKTSNLFKGFAKELSEACSIPYDIEGKEGSKPTNFDLISRIC